MYRVLICLQIRFADKYAIPGVIGIVDCICREIIPLKLVVHIQNIIYIRRIVPNGRNFSID